MEPTTIEQERRVFYKEVTAKDLTPGTTIDGFESLLDIEDFAFTAVSAISDKVRLYQLKGVAGKFKRLLEKDNPEKFFGRINKPVVKVLPLDESLVKVGEASKEITFTVSRDMHSTGRGKIGTLERKFTLYVSSDSKDDAIKMKSEAKGSFAALALRAESYSTSYKVRQTAIRHPVSGGLVSLGKKKYT